MKSNVAYLSRKTKFARQTLIRNKSLTKGFRLSDLREA